MNILILASGYPTQDYVRNGIFAFDQAQALANNGHNVIYLSVDVRSIRRWRKWGFTEVVENRVQIMNVSIPLGRFPQAFLHKISKYYFNKAYNKIVKKYGYPDIIHSHFLDIGNISVELFKKYDIPLVHTEHSSGMNQDNINKKDHSIGNNVYNSVDKLITVSSALSDNILNKFGVKSIVIPNIVDTKIFYNESSKKINKDFNFISVGNLVKNKRMDLLIKSFCDAFKTVKSVKLYIFGEGPEREKLEKLIKSKNMKSQVFLMGEVDRKIIAKQMKESDAFVLVSKKETFGVAFIEALASGLPIIATDSGGPRDIVTDNNGILIDDENKSGLTDALREMITKNSEFNNEYISRDAQKKYSPENIAEILTREYKSILK